jgi:hypothetical protein
MDIDYSAETSYGGGVDASVSTESGKDLDCRNDEVSEECTAFVLSSEAGENAARKAPPELAAMIRQAYADERREEIRRGMMEKAALPLPKIPGPRFEDGVLGDWHKLLEQFKNIPHALAAIIQNIRKHPGLAEALHLAQHST